MPPGGADTRCVSRTNMRTTKVACRCARESTAFPNGGCHRNLVSNTESAGPHGTAMARFDPDAIDRSQPTEGSS